MSLGNLEKVDLREAWSDEAKEFTPWVAENIDQIGDILGMDLEVKDTEKSVGSFNADILAKETNNGKEIVIENQLERSDHDHLGKLITYGSGIEAFSVVWICKDLKEEHRKAIDWLNESTRKNTNFFALEIELYKIGGSEPAPKFDTVCEPNEWSKRVKTETETLTPVEKLRQRYWSGFKEHMEDTNPSFSLRNSWEKHWYKVSIGKSHFGIQCTLSTRKNRVGVELYFNPDNAEDYFELLEEEKNQIEQEIGCELDWQRLEGKNACRIALYKNFPNIEDEENWNQQFQWLEENLYSFYNTFKPRVNQLEL